MHESLVHLWLIFQKSARILQQKSSNFRYSRWTECRAC